MEEILARIVSTCLTPVGHAAGLPEARAPFSCPPLERFSDTAATKNRRLSGASERWSGAGSALFKILELFRGMTVDSARESPRRCQRWHSLEAMPVRLRRIGLLVTLVLGL